MNGLATRFAGRSDLWTTLNIVQEHLIRRRNAQAQDRSVTNGFRANDGDDNDHI